MKYLNPVKVGQQPSASAENIIRATVNALNLANGNIVKGPGGFSFPTFSNLIERAGMQIAVDAYSADGGGYIIGEVVILSESVINGANETNMINAQPYIGVSAPSESNQTPIGIVTKDITSSTPGRVAISGLALARVVRPVTEAGLTKQYVMRLQTLSDESGSETIGAVTLGLGVADVIWEDSTSPGTSEHWALIQFPPRNTGADFAEATADASSGTVTVKFMQSDGTLSGEEITVDYGDLGAHELTQPRNGERLLVHRAADGTPVVSKACLMMPLFAEATSDPSGGTLTVKLAESDGTLVGSDITVYDGGIT